MPSSSVKKHSTKSSKGTKKSVAKSSKTKRSSAKQSSTRRKSSSKRSVKRSSTRRKSASKRSAKKTFAPGCPMKTHKQKYVSSVKRYVRSSVASPVVQSEAFCTIKSMKRFNDHLKRMPLVSTNIKPDDDVRVSKMCVYDAIRLAGEERKPILFRDVAL